jgi:MFS family permease
VPKFRPLPLIGLLGWSTFLASVDLSIVAVSLYNIADAFDVSFGQVQWVSHAYSISLASFSILAGKIGDRLCPTYVHRVGMILFTVCSFLCGASTTLNALIFWRAVQGFASAFLLANNLSLASILSTPHDLSATMSLNGVVSSVAAGLGPILGSFVTAAFNWRWIFYINILPGIAGLILCWIYLPKPPRIFQASFDWQGALMLFISLVALVFGITRIEVEVVSAVAIILASLFALWFTTHWELRHPAAIFPKEMLTHKPIMYSLFSGLIGYCAMTPLSYVLPYCLQYAFGYSLTTVGFVCLTTPFSMMVGGILGGALVPKYVGVRVRIPAFAVMTIGLLLAGNTAVATRMWLLVPSIALVGGGIGCFITSSNVFMMTLTPMHLKGVIGGAINTFRETGFSLGASLSISLSNAILALVWDGPVPIAGEPLPPGFFDAYMKAFDWTFRLMALIVSLGIFCTHFAGQAPFEAGRIGYNDAAARRAVGNVAKPDEASTPLLAADVV